VKHVDLSWDPWFKLTEVLKTGSHPFPLALNRKAALIIIKELVPLLFRTTHLVASGGAKALGIGTELKGLRIMDVAPAPEHGELPWPRQTQPVRFYGVDGRHGASAD